MAIAQNTGNRRPTAAPVDKTAEIREIDARILAIRKQMAQILDEASAGYGGSAEASRLMEMAQQRVALKRMSLKTLLLIRNDLAGEVGGGIVTAPNVGQGNGYFTTIEKENGNVLILGNKATVEITDSFIGFIGWNKKCLLFKDAGGYKIWIEGKKTFSCQLLRAPQDARPVELAPVKINEVKSDGKFLKLSDQRILKVGEFDNFATQFLVVPKDGLLLNTGELVILDDGKILKAEIVAE